MSPMCAEDTARRFVASMQEPEHRLVDHSGTTRMAVGVMTGTSLDGIDACALRLHGHGLDIRAEFIAEASQPLDKLSDGLRRLAQEEPMRASEIAALRTDLGLRCRDTVAALELETIDLIALHGQTVHHAPPHSWQLIDPFPVAARFGSRVACDLRGHDRALGGEGAPITPIADWILFRSERPTAIVNLGGFINCTVLPAADHGDPLSVITGFDVCPCNHLLDALARQALGRPYDDGGTLACSGSVCLEQVSPLIDRLRALRSDARSLGTGDEGSAWIPDLINALGPADSAATVCAAIARVLVESIDPDSVDLLLLAGGGVHNVALVEAITATCKDNLTVGRLHHGHAREAASMAVLAALAEDGVPITLPQVTGRQAGVVRDGAWVLNALENQTP